MQGWFSGNRIDMVAVYAVVNFDVTTETFNGTPDSDPAGILFKKM